MHDCPTDSTPLLDPRDSLRRATAALHERVDAGMPLSNPDPGLGDYARHLSLLREWVDALRSHRPALAPRLTQEATAIDADLAVCGQLLDDAAPVHHVSPSDFVASATDDAEAFDWGIAYVLEGSRLGGQVLYRRLAEPLAPHPLDYLRGAGAATGARWKAFLAELSGALDTPARIRTACDGAVMAFDLLLRCHAGRPCPAEATR